jgi:hypothetical protein
MDRDAWAIMEQIVIANGSICTPITCRRESQSGIFIWEPSTIT